jgi:hypothetical protein
MDSPPQISPLGRYLSHPSYLAGNYRHLMRTSSALVSSLSGLFGIIFCISCHFGPRTVEVDGRFRLTLPPYLQDQTGLHDSAPLQTGDRVKDLYLIARYENKMAIKSKKNNFSQLNYYDTTVDNLLYLLENSNYSDPEQILIDRMPCLSGQITGQYKEQEITYHLWVIESSQNYYQLLAWGPSSSFKTYEPELESAVRSFQLLNKAGQ